MKVQLALDGYASEETLENFVKSKKFVPDTAPVLMFFFSKKVLLSDLIVDLTSMLSSVKTYQKDDVLLASILGSDRPIIEFILNLKMLSMKIGKLLFEFEESLGDGIELYSFIQRHKMVGFNLIFFKDLVNVGKYDEALSFLHSQYESLKKSLYVLYQERYNLLESKGYI